MTEETDLAVLKKEQNTFSMFKKLFLSSQSQLLYPKFMEQVK
jgi:hypothetical protein